MNVAVETHTHGPTTPRIPDSRDPNSRDHSHSVDHPYPWSGRLLAGTIDAMMQALDLRWSGGENAILALKNHGNLVVTFWHEWVLPLSFTLKSNGFCALTSRHHDGARLGSALRYLGVEVCHGSSTRGGLRGFQELEVLAKRGLSPVISVDGPKGPPRIAKEGAAALARRLKIPMIPIGFSANSQFRLNTWDRMIVPYPGTKALVVVGDPVFPGDHRRDDSAISGELGTALNQATEDAQNEFSQRWRTGTGTSPLGSTGLTSAKQQSPDTP